MERAKAKGSPAVQMRIKLQELMTREQLWDDHLINDIPKTWEKYGNLLLFNGEKYFRDERWLHAPGVWECVCCILSANRIALKHYIKKDSLRSPNVSLMYGINSWVEYKDNGIIYCWDVLNNMFCAGNAPERHRISILQCEGETIVDMYAGIGYFTLPYLVKTKAKLVHACEWNPKAIKALKHNLSKNNVADRCIIHEGDSTLISPKGVADRVNLGLLPSSESGWNAACEALNPTSVGTLHIHQNVVSGLKRHTKTCSSIVTMLSCKSCRMVLNENNLFEESMVENNIFMDIHNHFSFSLEGNNLSIIDNMRIKWKKEEWKLWALHVCHSLRDIFMTIHEGKSRKIVICNMHHVKSYAPHIDHLVLDVKCIPV